MKARTKGIIWSYAYTVANMISGLFLSSYLLRTLGDTDYGIYQTVASFSNCLVMLEFGTGTVLTRNIVVCRSRNASKEEIDRNISTVWIITLALSALITVTATGLCLGMDRIYANSMTAEQIAYAKRIYVVMAVYLLASFMLQTARSTALGFENYTFSSRVNLTRVILRTGLIVWLIHFSQSAIYIALTDAFLSVALLVFTLVFCKIKLKVTFRFRYFTVTVFRASLGLSIALFIQSIVNQVNTNVDKFLIGVLVNPETVSLYGVGMYVFSIFLSLSMIPITMYAPPIISEVTLNGLHKGLYDVVLKSGKMITLIGGTIFFGFMAAGRPFIAFFYGDEYVAAWAIALILMSSAFLNMITGALNNVLDALNKRIFRSLVILVTTALNVVLTVWWLPVYGIVGAAVATALCTAVGQVLVMGIYYTVNLKINMIGIYLNVTKSIIVFQFLAMAAAWTVSNWIHSDVNALFAGMCVYVVVFFVLYLMLSRDGRRQIKRILKRKE